MHTHIYIYIYAHTYHICIICIFECSIIRHTYVCTCERQIIACFQIKWSQFDIYIHVYVCTSIHPYVLTSITNDSLKSHQPSSTPKSFLCYHFMYFCLFLFFFLFIAFYFYDLTSVLQLKRNNKKLICVHICTYVCMCVSIGYTILETIIQGKQTIILWWNKKKSNCLLTKHSVCRLHCWIHTKKAPNSLLSMSIKYVHMYVSMCKQQIKFCSCRTSAYLSTTSAMFFRYFFRFSIFIAFVHTFAGIHPQ